MRLLGARRLLGMVAMVSALAPATVAAPAAAEVQESSDRAFRLEWAKEGRKVDGYVDNQTSRHAAKMSLLVEDVDGSGKAMAAIASYSWIQEIASSGDRRRAR